MSRKIKYTKEFKFKTVEKVLKNNLSLTAVSDELSINKSDLKKWIKYYQAYGISGLTPRTTNTNYTFDFKLKVILSIEKKGLSFREASLKYNIPSHSTVQSWYLIYQDKGVIGLHKGNRAQHNSMNKGKPKKSTKKPLTREEELLKENESLKAELALLKKLHALAQAKKKKQ